MVIAAAETGVKAIHCEKPMPPSYAQALQMDAACQIRYCVVKRVHPLASIAARANTLVQLFPPGEEGGSGLADVLTGAVHPHGRLPVSLPRSVEQIPMYNGYRAGGDRPMFFDDYIDCPPRPLFACGHGLSYTSFTYEQFTVRGTTTDELIEVSVVVCNTGERAGDEVVQLYIRDQVASVTWPDRILIGFTRVALDLGQARSVAFTVHPSRLAFYDSQMRFVVEPGIFRSSVAHPQPIFVPSRRLS
jgi:beta-glucosidase